MNLRKKLYVINGETASQKNSQNFFRGHVVKSVAFMAWKRFADIQIKSQGVPSEPYASASIAVEFVHSDLRRRDGDNALASVQDALVRNKVIADDCWTKIGTPSVTHSVGAEAMARIEVTETEPIDWAAELKRAKR